ncbi:MAG: transposase, partial [Candidatus Binatia bacterium]
VLLYVTAPVALGWEFFLRRVFERLSERFPDIKFNVSADSGFASPQIYEALEQLRVQFSIGFTVNAKLKRLSESCMEEAISAHKSSGQPEVRYLLVENYRAKKWSRPRDIVVKCEVTAHSTSRRAVITNRPGVLVSPEGVYCEYADRGESENRNKELKCEFRADRLSDHRYMANLFRLMMHTLAANLLVAMRRVVAAPPTASSVDGVPPEASSPYMKRQFHNQRRKQDPLGEGHACTWRTQVIKVAARVVVSTRRVCLQLSASWPHFHDLAKVAQAVVNFSRPTPSG